MYATGPNFNIAICNFTIACWIRLAPVIGATGTETILMGSSKNGKLLRLTVQRNFLNYHYNVYVAREISMNTRLWISRTLVPVTAVIDTYSWIHIAVTCQQYHNVSVYVNGKLYQSEDYVINGTLQEIGRPDKRTYRIGNYMLYGQPSYQMYGSIMDLHIIGINLPDCEISNLHKGKQRLIKQ